ncbi:hypothetical protein C2G38_2226505 [Gigaspora rosea]|uniref:Uncharacterized protein n=1 Tax=Gigaspora rosea TaxID=44941 RepID=A0A397U2A8_9GLOM|nr:hypothetical protein C2G38_2226505 [Gigaspora rosea]
MTSKSVDFLSHKTCNNCHEFKEINEFLKNNKALVWCQLCRNKRTISQLNKNNNQRHEATITYSDIDEFVYNSLTSLEDTNDFYEDNNVELVISFDVELSFLFTTILDENKENFNDNENLYLEVASCTAKFIKNGDEVHRDTPIRIEQYNCEGVIKIKILVFLNIIKIDCSHLILHPRPIHVATTLEVQEFIRNSINYLVLELHRQIRKKELKGYENLTVQQTYFWWSKESQKMYHCNSDPFILTKLLLNEYNQKIIIDITTPTPALGFLTLCSWHVLRAIKQRIASNQQNSNCSYDPIVAYQKCSAVDPCWKKFDNHVMFVFCPSNLRKQVIDLVKLHYNRHILLPKSNSEYYMSLQAIWEDCVKEIVSFCKKNNLIDLWIYLWNNWYCQKRWILWARAANINSVSKVDIDFFKRVQQNGNYPIIATYEGEFVNFHNSKVLEISMIKS